ncbi:MAG: nicotinamide-nucleotide adenylyltransferase [Nanoarchaeota archaeon]|nr:nicotinamide-nucleotide adenylyltransferase [Nanoarchaeota archaeon]
MTTGLIIGRFQPFHKGHYNAIKSVIEDKGHEDIKKLIFGIGSAQLKNQLENPFSYDERRLMIDLSFKENNCIEVYPITDINNYGKWVKHVIDSVPHFDYVLTNNEITRQLFEEDGYPVKNLPIETIISGVEIREMIIKGNDCSDLLPEGTRTVMKEIKGYERIKQLYRNSHRNPVPTTDVIIELHNQKGDYKGLVFIERKNIPYGLALPGGFHEYGLSAEQNAIKEAKEETGLDIELINQLGVYSDPDRDPRSHTISTVFIAKAYGIPKAGDDAKNVIVASENNIPDNLVFDHNKIIKDYQEWRKNEKHYY